MRRVRRQIDAVKMSPESRLRSTLSFLVGAFLLAVAVSSIGLAAALGLLSTDLPERVFADLPAVEQVVEGRAFKTAMIYDRNGRLLYELWDPDGGRRFVVPLRSMPQFLVDATLATEDPRFYENPGFDAVAISRATIQNLRGQTILSGASTITQQLVRYSLFDPSERYEQSAYRKIKEIVLAYQLSQRYSKDEILERYLNEIYYGNLSYGIEAAAQSYFGKSVGDLTVAEAAMLVGLPQSPTANDPLTNPEGARERQLEVLGLMVRHGYLSEAAAVSAAAEQLQFRPPRVEIKAPHFSLYVRSMLEARFTREELYYSGLKVYTTLDLDLQQLAERQISEEVAKAQSSGIGNAALVAISPRTGEVLAMVGSADYWDEAISGQVNMALAERQPGPVLRPLTYLTAFARGKAAPTSQLLDEPTSFYGGLGQPAYRPQNSDGAFRGPITARQAIAEGLNVPAVRLLEVVGVPAMLDLAHALGITSLNKSPGYYGLSLALGTGEVRLIDLTYAYGVIANGGLQVGEPVPGSERQPGRREFRPVVIARVEDASGKLIDEYRPTGKQVVSSEVSWLLTDVLQNAESPDRKVSRPAVLLSGTTETGTDNWAVGYTPNLAVGVWMGGPGGGAIRPPATGTGAVSLWRAYVERSLDGTPAHGFERPSGIVRASVDAKTGLRPVPGKPTVIDWVVEASLTREWNVPSPTPTPVPTATPTPTPTPTPRPTVTPTPPMAMPTVHALGPNEVRVPSLVGLTEAEARGRIEAARLANAHTNRQTAADVADQAYFRSVPVGHVLSQMPAPNTIVQRGTTVYIAVRAR